MSDYGDFCKEQRQERQRLRMFWHECPTCAAAYGTGTSVPPGGKCRNCGWDAPGNRGDDVRAAEQFSERMDSWTKNPRNRGDWECPYCDMSFGSKAGRGDHVSKKHGAEHLERRASLKNKAREASQ